MAVSDEFKRYAWRSVRLDQCFHATNVFATHYEPLKESYKLVPRGDSWPHELIHAWPEAVRMAFVVSMNTLNYMETTGIFQDTSESELNFLTLDMRNNAFDTSYCFQWVLFEEFVRTRISTLIDSNTLSVSIANSLNKLERRTEALFKYLDAGHVFGKSPFWTLIPKPGWELSFEECGYADLDTIRRTRNYLVHGNANASIDRGDRNYSRSMWVLRKYAENIDQLTEGLIGGDTPSAAGS